MVTVVAFTVSINVSHFHNTYWYFSNSTAAVPNLFSPFKKKNGLLASGGPSYCLNVSCP